MGEREDGRIRAVFDKGPLTTTATHLGHSHTWVIVLALRGIRRNWCAFQQIYNYILINNKDDTYNNIEVIIDIYINSMYRISC